MGAGPDTGARGAGTPRPSEANPSDSAIRTTTPKGATDDAAARREQDNTQELRVRAAPTIAETDLEPFARFGRFELLGRIATGGMAEILLARESAEEAAGSRHVVIKAVRGEYAEDGDFAKMFLDEGRLAMRLTHPNICTVYECGRHDGRFFIAMEYVHGRTLREVLVRAGRRRRPLPIPVLLRAFALVAEALDFAHRAKDPQGRDLSVVHRDVSPHNIMLRYDGVVKLLDFGVAKAEHGHHSTQSGALKGKFSYMSPEQAMGNTVDARADVFSLGVCIFEAVTGRRLFQRKVQYDTLKAILETEPPQLAELRDDVPAGLQEIVTRALAKAPDDRYQRASELQHALDSLLNDMREVASTARIAELMEDLFTEEARRAPTLEIDDELRARYAPAAPDEHAAPRAASRRGRRWPLLAAITAALGLAGGAAWVALGERTEDPSATAEPPPAPAAPVLEDAPAPPEPEPEPPALAEADEAIASPAPTAGDATLPAAAAADALGRNAPRAASREEASPRPRTQRRASPGPRPRRGTVIVTDPGF